MYLRVQKNINLLYASFVLMLCLGLVPKISCADKAETIAPLIVTHPFDHTGDAIYEQRMQYFVKLLQLALSKSGRAFELQAVQMPISTGSRNTRNLENGLYDVHWLHTNTEREQQLLPVRIPLYKGMIGWRLLVTRSDFENELEKISTINQLRFLNFGLGHDWPDTFVMLENGFEVTTAVNRISMYKMLRRKRTDVVTRSVLEVWDEQKEFDFDDVVLEGHLVLQYPSAFYFFLNRQNEKLASLIESGLEKAVKDGSFDQIFWDTYGESISKANLPKRKILHIPNPLIPKRTAVDRAELWFSLADLEKRQR